MSGDDPGAGVEPDTVVAQMRVEHLPQILDGASRGGGVQPLQDLAGAREAADPVEGGGHVRTVVDRFVDVGEGDAVESRSLQDLLHGRRVGERERVRSPAGTGYR